MIELNSEKIIDGVYYLSSPGKQEFNESSYIKLREKEGRIYSDEELRLLPEISASHKLKDEWNVRKKTMKKLVNYFRDKENKNILEVGSGNGWLSNAIASGTNNFLVALDVNQAELKQGAIVFKDNAKLKFVYGNIYENIFPSNSFDAIIFPASIQYFKNPGEIIERVFYFLKPNGEIHIVDSNFYPVNEIGSARLRSEKYYEGIGFREMSEFYFHHSWKDLGRFNYRVTNKFSIRISKIKKEICFPWIIIRQ